MCFETEHVWLKTGPLGQILVFKTYARNLEVVIQIPAVHFNAIPYEEGSGERLQGHYGPLVYIDLFSYWYKYQISFSLKLVLV